MATADDATDLFAQHGIANNVDPLMMQAIGIVESGNRNIDAHGQPIVSPTGAKGRMQFTGVGTPGGTAYRYGVTDPFNDQQTIPAASRLMSDNLTRANGDVRRALQMYNGSNADAYPEAVFATWRNLQAQQKAAIQAASSKGTTAVPAIQQSASDDDAFWSSLGNKNAPPPPDPATAVSGFANSVARGIHQATDIPANALASAADYVAGKFGYPTHFAQDANDASTRFNQAYDANPDNKGIGPAVGRFAGNAAVTLPLAMTGGGAVEAGLVGAGEAVPAAANLLRWATPVASGAAQGATVAGMNGDPIGSSAVLGGGLGAAGGLVGAGVNQLIGEASPAVRTAIEKYGIPLRAGQTSDSAFVRKLDQMAGQLPFSGRGAQNEAQKVAVNNAVGQTFGENVPKITPAVMENAKARIGGVMDDIENANTVKVGNQGLDKLAEIEANAHSAMEDGEFAVVKRQLDNIRNKVDGNGEITGKTYGDMIGHGSPLDAALNSRNSNIANYAGQIKSTLQDSLNDSLPPADAARYAAARLQYKNMMTVAPLVNKGTPGDISPLLLQGAANRSFKGNAFRGAGDLGEIGDLGQTYLRPPADSGTPLGNAILGGFWQPAVALGRVAAGATAGKVAGMVTNANPLTGYQGPGILGRAALPAAVLLRNNLLQQPN